ncbi:MAG: hypothetical protein ACK57N_06345 [Planctomycetia bacterium]|jgi:hypothetical protein
MRSSPVSRRLLCACLSFACASCASIAPREPRWRPGEWILQGQAGLRTFDVAEREADTVSVEVDELSPAPFVGGGGQWKHGEGPVDVGAEVMLGLGWRPGFVGVYFDSATGAAVQVDIDAFVADLGGGLFASTFVADRLRVHGAVGPLVQIVAYSESDPDIDGAEFDASGFGAGWYARGGVELLVADGVMMGVGARWTDTRTNLGSDLGDLRLSGVDWFLSVSTGF